MTAVAFVPRLAEQAAESINHRYATDEYAQRAEDRIRIYCGGLEGSIRAECIAKTIDAVEEQRRAEEDLRAQNNMARSTLWMMWASIFAVILTFVGVVYVRRTLDQTVAANSAAQAAVSVTREIGKAQVRAYLSISDARVVNVYLSGHPKLILKVRNTGQSPAWGCRTVGYFGIIESNPHTHKFKSNGTPKMSETEVGAGLSVEQHMPLGRKLSQHDIERLKAGDVTFLAGCIVTYKDVFGTTHRMIARLHSPPLERDDGTALLQASSRNNRSN